MSTKSADKCHLVLRLPKATVELIDTVARAANLSRSRWLRIGIQRALSYSIEHELPVLQQVQAVLNPSGEPR